MTGEKGETLLVSLWNVKSEEQARVSSSCTGRTSLGAWTLSYVCTKHAFHLTGTMNRVGAWIIHSSIHSLIATWKPQSNGPSYSNTVIGTLAVDEWAVTFGTVRRELGRATAHPGPSSPYQMLQPTHQRPVYELRIIRCGTIIALQV